MGYINTAAKISLKYNKYNLKLSNLREGFSLELEKL